MSETEGKKVPGRCKAEEREKYKSMVGISGNKEVWKLIPVERSRRAL